MRQPGSTRQVDRWSMGVVERLKRRLRRVWLDRSERWRLDRLSPTALDVSALRGASTIELSTVFGGDRLLDEWRETERLLSRFAVPDGTGGVNPGDRRALYYLARSLRSLRVLEIGTHIGASTAHLALAIRRNETDPALSAVKSALITVDIEDVNDSASRRWEAFGVKSSPRQMVEELGCGDRVTFVHERSVEFMDECAERFDLVFLDGNHDAEVVYAEVPRALRLLVAGGVVLLHDYYPDARPIWPGAPVIRGPFLAIKRFLDEGADITVLPCGELPWPTKLGSRLTSLAVLAGGRL